ncbi:hypothetical protein CCR75_008088 [Bremia lactucae]|uniref:Uncharacterized protein n=1 Tax=Bremia lactucae TaxID=4779 RepID=A0A976IKD3_BRELC|nr:hypothetical protein CCR75_008088 [Bremia lactucae]
MVGLSASELQNETLFPGDTIEYYSMAFVAGDPRGHRVAKVLSVDRNDNEFPIRVDTQEMLPLTIMLKRKRDRNDSDISLSDAKWRKLRTFKLVFGEVVGQTRADVLNAGLAKSLLDAMRSTRKTLEKDGASLGNKKLMSKYFSSYHAPIKDKTFDDQSDVSKDVLMRDTRKTEILTCSHEDTNQGDETSALTKRCFEEKKLSIKAYVDLVQLKQISNRKKQAPRKRKRDSSTLNSCEQRDGVSKNYHDSLISNYFPADKCQRKKCARINLKRFLNHVQETNEVTELKKIEAKTQKVWGLDVYDALDERKKVLELKIKAEMSNCSTASRKKVKNVKQASCRMKHLGPNTSLQSWLKPLKQRKEILDDRSEH